jgi:hypothetical protein
MKTEHIKKIGTGLIGATLYILGLQLLLIPPIHLLDIYVFQWNLWPSMTLWKAVLISLLGLALFAAGRLIGQSVENPFFDSDRGDEL